jgi:hypothetical protein
LAREAGKGRGLLFNAEQLGSTDVDLHLKWKLFGGSRGVSE